MERSRNISGPSIKRLEIAVVLLFCLLAGYAFSFSTFSTSAETAPEITETAPEIIEPAQSYTKFQHSEPQHARMPCLVCHKRQEGLTKPKFPGHLPCAGCHVQQFADNKNPICTICHTPTDVKPFPALRSFNIKFDHGKHLKQTSCATCHKPSRRGAALSVPSGASAHQTCFQCHGPRTEVGGRNIGSCSTCHQPGRPIRGSDWSRAYAINFSHQEHARRGNLNCAACHTVLAGSARGRQVTSPLPSMHFAPAGKQSCLSCHNDRRAFGIKDPASCKRCHEGRTFKF